jgi:hypothetical protein
VARAFPQLAEVPNALAHIAGYIFSPDCSTFMLNACTHATTRRLGLAHRPPRWLPLLNASTSIPPAARRGIRGLAERLKRRAHDEDEGDRSKGGRGSGYGLKKREEVKIREQVEREGDDETSRPKRGNAYGLKPEEDHVRKRVEAGEEEWEAAFMENRRSGRVADEEHFGLKRKSEPRVRTNRPETVRAPEIIESIGWREPDTRLQEQGSGFGLRPATWANGTSDHSTHSDDNNRMPYSSRSVLSDRRVHFHDAKPSLDDARVDKEVPPEADAPASNPLSTRRLERPEHNFDQDRRPTSQYDSGQYIGREDALDDDAFASVRAASPSRSRNFTALNALAEQMLRHKPEQQPSREEEKEESVRELRGTTYGRSSLGALMPLQKSDRKPVLQPQSVSKNIHDTLGYIEDKAGRQKPRTEYREDYNSYQSYHSDSRLPPHQLDARTSPESNSPAEPGVVLHGSRIFVGRLPVETTPNEVENAFHSLGFAPEHVLMRS